MPAVTIVAAWISAETGVGPAIASGNHVYHGICALFPVVPMNRCSVVALMSYGEKADPSVAILNTSAQFALPFLAMLQKMAIRNARPPVRFMMNAFLAA